MIPGNYRHKKTWDLEECWDTCPLCAFNKGRASRDGLRKAMLGVLEAPDDHSKGPDAYDNAWAEFHKALKADEEGK